VIHDYTLFLEKKILKLVFFSEKLNVSITSVKIACWHGFHFRTESQVENVSSAFLQVITEGLLLSL